MKQIPDEIIQFLNRQNFVIISSNDKEGTLHNSCKGIVKVYKDKRIYLFDLYKGKTYANLKRNPRVSLTAVDEHKFRGYCLKGKAKIIKTAGIRPYIIKAWEDKVISRISHRLLKNIRGEKGHSKHPEALLPKPEYLISVKIDSIIDLTPRRLKE